MNYVKIIYHFYRDLFFSSKKWIQFTVWTFVVAIIVGWAVYDFYPSLMQAITEMFKNIGGDNPGITSHFALAIYKQNIQSSLIALFGGVILGAIPFFLVWFNGFIPGYIIHYFTVGIPAPLGKKLLFLSATLIPHGIFEIPIILISAALGMRLGLNWIQKQPDKGRWQVFTTNLKENLLFIPLLAFVLLVAAYIEVFVSARLGDLILK